MEDAQIIELFWHRDEQAIAETAAKYGAFCYGIAMNILAVREDAEECVNDAYHRVWNAIPPQRPVRFRSWLGKIVRNLALNLWDRRHAEKRGAGLTELLGELAECIPSPRTVERELEDRKLTEAVDRWLRSLDREDQVLFVRRYWYGVALRTLAEERAISPGKLAQRMYRLRQSLRSALEKDGVSI